VIEATQIGGRRSDRLVAGKLSPDNFDFCNNIGTWRHLAALRNLIAIAAITDIDQAASAKLDL